MKELRLSSPFKKDLKRITRRGYDRALLDAVVDLLRDARNCRRPAETMRSKANGRATANATSSRTGC